MVVIVGDDNYVADILQVLPLTFGTLEAGERRPGAAITNRIALVDDFLRVTCIHVRVSARDTVLGSRYGGSPSSPPQRRDGHTDGSAPRFCEKSPSPISTTPMPRTSLRIRGRLSIAWTCSHWMTTRISPCGASGHTSAFS